MPAPAANSALSSEPAALIRPFMPELDTLRGIAVLGVLLLHAFFWQYAGYSFGPFAKAFLFQNIAHLRFGKIECAHQPKAASFENKRRKFFL